MAVKRVYPHIRTHTREITHLLKKLWPNTLQSACLIATGGFGRHMLFPYSDIDVLILVPTGFTAHDKIIEFVQSCWDHRLPLHHSVRTLADCAHDASQDQTFYTALLEMYYLKGSQSLYQKLKAAVFSEIWLSEEVFLTHKKTERAQRLKQFGNNLEPHLKKCPGGFRDIHLMYWLALKHFKKNSLFVLRENDFLTSREFRQLWHAVFLLAKIRLALHHLAGKTEERLLFEYQIKLAQQFGFQENDQHKAVEQFMQRFYEATQTVQYLCDLVLNQLEASLYPQRSNPISLSSQFQICFNRIDLTPRYEKKLLSASDILDGLYLFCQYPYLDGISPRFMRAMVETVSHLNEEMAYKAEVRQRMLRLFDQRYGITRSLIQLNLCGFLQKYLPASKHTKHQMQFDLFHVHTVDVHTLEVIKELRSIILGEKKKSLVLASEIAAEMNHYRLLYLAALFHDMGKGTGEDHAQWGAAKIREFGHLHELPYEEIQLMSWLVLNHLYFSETAQKADINDPMVIETFCKKIGSIKRLNHLYLLTVADIRGTNLKLWTQWRATLLEQLYHMAKQFLVHQAHQNKIYQDNIKSYLSSPQREWLERLWPSLPLNYFSRFSPQEIANHLTQLQKAKVTQSPIVEVLKSPCYQQCEVLITSNRKPFLFATVTHTIAQLNLSIAEARIYSFESEALVLASFIVLQANGYQIKDKHILKDLKIRLEHSFEQGIMAAYHGTPRLERNQSLKYFKAPPALKIEPHPIQPHALVITFKTLDRVGLLADIAQVLKQFHYRIFHAKVMTIGEKVEDQLTILPQAAPCLTIDKLYSALATVLT